MAIAFDDIFVILELYKDEVQANLDEKIYVLRISSKCAHKYIFRCWFVIYKSHGNRFRWYFNIGGPSHSNFWPMLQYFSLFSNILYSTRPIFYYSWVEQANFWPSLSHFQTSRNNLARTTSDFQTSRSNFVRMTSHFHAVATSFPSLRVIFMLPACCPPLKSALWPVYFPFGLTSAAP